MIRAVLFDLDGTLLDSAPDLVAALNHVRESEGLEPLPLASLRSSASRGALGLLQVGMPPTDADTLEAWRLAFLARYQEFNYSASTLFPGVPELLDYLAANRIAWGVVTNKPRYLTVPIVAAAGWEESIGCLVCGDTLAERKPHPAPVLLACEQLAVAPCETVFVGDDVRDLEAGMAAGVVTCGALYGYGSSELQLDEHSALLDRAFTIDRPAALREWLERRIGSHAVP